MIGVRYLIYATLALALESALSKEKTFTELMIREKSRRQICPSNIRRRKKVKGKNRAPVPPNLVIAGCVDLETLKEAIMDNEPDEQDDRILAILGVEDEDDAEVERHTASSTHHGVSGIIGGRK